MDKDLLNAIKGDKDKPSVPDDKLEAIRTMARAMRDLTKEIEDMEARTKEKKAELARISMNDLVTLMEENKVSAITLEAEGNYPRYELEAKPYYKAVLPRDKITDKVLPAGPEWLKKNGAADLIKRVFVVTLPMDSDKLAVALRKFLIGPVPAKKKGKKAQPFVPRYRFEEKEDVPWATLTSFVKERIEKLKKPVPLETLGATVGKIVRMKEVKNHD